MIATSTYESAKLVDFIIKNGGNIISVTSGDQNKPCGTYIYYSACKEVALDFQFKKTLRGDIV